MGMFGALVGAAIDRTDGDSGITGAIIGMVAQKAVSVVAPLAITFAIGWAVQKAIGVAWNALPDMGSDKKLAEDRSYG